MYTVTANAITYTHGDATISPSYCNIVYEYNIEALNNGGTPITRSGKTFTIHYTADLTPVAESPLTVTVTARS